VTALGAGTMAAPIAAEEMRTGRRMALEQLAADFEAKYPKAVTSLRRDQDKLLTFFRYPAEHWRHLRTTNAVESPFATVRLRQRVTKGAGSRTKGMLMASTEAIRIPASSRPWLPRRCLLGRRRRRHLDRQRLPRSITRRG
jgi:hypothetical protein